jgi:hypothetical protein
MPKSPETVVTSTTVGVVPNPGIAAARQHQPGVLEVDYHINPQVHLVIFSDNFFNSQFQF